MPETPPEMIMRARVQAHTAALGEAAVDVWRALPEGASFVLILVPGRPPIAFDSTAEAGLALATLAALLATAGGQAPTLTQ